STIASNRASFEAGGIYNESYNYSVIGRLTITNCTISQNQARYDGGILTDQNFNTSTRLFNTIVAANGPDDLSGHAVATDSAFNLIGNAGSAGGLVNGVNGNIVGVDPKLGPLAYNGGPTQTMALLPFSPALNAGGNALIPPGVTTDQRGNARIRANTVDIGAFEVQDDGP